MSAYKHLNQQFHKEVRRKELQMIFARLRKQQPQNSSFFSSLDDNTQTELENEEQHLTNIFQRGNQQIRRYQKIEAGELLKMGENTIQIQRKESEIYLGTKIKEYFTKQGVWMLDEDIKSLYQKGRYLMEIPVTAHEKIIQKISMTHKVGLVKDFYKGAVYYGVRNYIYIDGELTFTRCGFNLTQNQFSDLIDKIGNIMVKAGIVL